MSEIVAKSVLDKIENDEKSLQGKSRSILKVVLVSWIFHDFVKEPDVALAIFLKAILNTQLGKFQDAEKLLNDNTATFKSNENVYLYPAAQLEIGNLYRLVGELIRWERTSLVREKFWGLFSHAVFSGDFSACERQMKKAKEQSHYPFEARLHYRCHGYEQLTKSQKWAWENVESIFSRF